MIDKSFTKEENDGSWMERKMQGEACLFGFKYLSLKILVISLTKFD